jgi:hypothetical protein
VFYNILKDLCAEELRRARQNLNTKEGGYMKARDSTIRHVNSVPANSGSADLNRKLKELEKRRRNEVEALNRVYLISSPNFNTLIFRKQTRKMMSGS